MLFLPLSGGHIPLHAVGEQPVESGEQPVESGQQGDGFIAQ